MKTTRFTRLLSGLFGAIVATAALSTAGPTTATATPTATATTGVAAQASSSVGGPITRSEILRRAQHWVDQRYTYGTLRCCPDADGDRTIVSTTTAPDSSGKAYRTDCSGLVAMAWHLNNSPTSGEFMNGSNVGRTIISLDELKPGDALVKNGHIELFSHWKNDNDHSQGAYVFSFNNYGETVQNPYADTGAYTSDSPNYAPYTDPAPGTYHATGHRGFNTWNDPNKDRMTSYTAIRYNNVVDDAPGQSSGSVVYNGTMYEFVRGSDNTVKYWFAHDTSGWAGVQTIAGGPIASEPVAAVFNGILYVFAVGTDNTIKYWFAHDNTGWSGMQTMGSAVSGGVGAGVFNGALYVFARGTDGSVKYWYAYDNSGWVGAQTIPASITGPISTAVFNGIFYVFATGTDNTVKYWFAHDTSGWSGTQTVGSAVSGGVTSTVFNGALYVFTRGADGTVKYWFAYDSSGWAGTGTLSGSVSGGLSSTVFNGLFYVFARGTGGSVKYWFANGGPWSGMQTLATQA